MASKKLSTDTSLANSYKLSRGVASVARPSAPTIGTATDGGSGNMSVTFTASTLGPTASSFTLTSSSGVTGSGASSPLTLQEVATGTYTYSVSGVNANGTGPSSAASNSVNVASVFDPSGAYDSIATTTLGSSQTTVTFSSIPSTYTHLQIRMLTKSGHAGIEDGYVRLNSDTGSNYSWHIMTGNGSSTAAYSGTSAGFMRGFRQVGNSSSANVFSGTVIDILDYANTSKNKTIRGLSGYDNNGAGDMSLYSGNWMSTTAVNTITLTTETGSNFLQYSSFALYGIKGA